MANYDAISKDRIVELIQSIPAERGRTFKRICEEAGLCYVNILRRIGKDDELGQLYAQARKDYMLARVESLAEIEEETRKEIKGLDDMRMSSALVQLARLKADNIKWEAERVLRTIYGVKVEHSGADGGPLQVAVTSYSDTKETQPPTK